MSDTILRPCAAARSRCLRRGMAVLTASIILIGLSQSCSQNPNKPSRQDPRLLVIDGIEVTFEDLKPYYDFLTANRPEAGEKTKYIWALRDHVLPLKVARRAFAKERAEQLSLAQGLCSVATNVYELEEQSKLIEHKIRKNITRQSAMLPVALFVFDPIHTNAVSPPIELPQGYFVVSTFDLNEGPLVMTDYVDCLQVGFVTHTSLEWRTWWEAEQLRIGNKVTFVHPDYRDDMPPWIQVPKDKKP